MSNLERQVQRARQRLTLNILLHSLVQTTLFAAIAWAVAILIVRAFALPVPIWHGAWLAVVLALIAALIMTTIRRPTLLHAAVSLDGAAGLKERLSSALALRGVAEPFARATVQDAERTAGKVHVPAHIRYRAPELLPWSGATFVAALLLAWLMPTLDLFAATTPEEVNAPRLEVMAEHRAIDAELQKKLASLKELSKNNPELKNLIENIEPLELPEDAHLTRDDVRRNAVKRIDEVREKLAAELEKTPEDVLSETRRMFQQLNDQGMGADQDNELSRALAKGDFKGAREALEDLAKQIEQSAKNASDPAARQKLAELQQQMQRMAEQVSQLGDTTRLQKELKNKAGLSEEDAKKLLEKLDQMDPKALEKALQQQLGQKGLSQDQIKQLAKKIQQNQQARQQCQNLAQKLAQAAQACQKCQNPGSAQDGAGQASNALSDAAAQLSDLEMAQQMAAEMEAQLSDLSQMRQQVCEGGMCPRGSQRSQGQQKIGQQGQNEGLGTGAHVGQQRVAYQKDVSKANTRLQPGEVIGRMFVDGPQVKGNASAEAVEAAEAEIRDQLDAVEREDVPQQYQRALQVYFERLTGQLREVQGQGDEGT